MLIVLAGAVAEPLPGETAHRQARLALQILDRAAELLPQPTHAILMRRAACLERSGEMQAAKLARSAAAATQPSGAFDHFLSGLECYKQGLLPQAKIALRSGRSRQAQRLLGKVPAGDLSPEFEATAFR